MKIIDTICVAFAMYSRIPTKKTQWNSQNMKYAMCALPLIGAVIGLIAYAFWRACDALNFGSNVVAAGIVLLPILITGGIHFDGFCDTSDALASNADISRKLEIMKDPNSGAFAIIAAIAYFLVYYSAAMEFEYNTQAMICIGLGFMLSRSLSGIAVASFKYAKNSGLLHAFAGAAHKSRVRLVLCVMALTLCVALVFTMPAYGVAMIIAACVCYFCYFRMAYNKFGGITGDLAGYFLQMCEIAMFCAVLVVQKLI